jgi:hypothetical protein
VAEAADRADAGRYTLALAEAWRGLDKLDDELTRVRDRAGRLLTIGALAASFLGGLSLRDDAKLTGATRVGIGALCAVMVLSAVVLFPRRLYSTVDPDDLVFWGDDSSMTVDDMRRNLAIYLTRKYPHNRQVVETLTWLTVAAGVAMLIEVGAFVFDLRSR